MDALTSIYARQHPSILCAAVLSLVQRSGRLELRGLGSCEQVIRYRSTQRKQGSYLQPTNNQEVIQTLYVSKHGLTVMVADRTVASMRGS